MKYKLEIVAEEDEKNDLTQMLHYSSAICALDEIRQLLRSMCKHGYNADIKTPSEMLEHLYEKVVDIISDNDISFL